MNTIPLKKKRYFYLLNSALIFLMMGVGYTWSIFMGPLEEWFGWSRTQTSLAFTINMICFSVGAISCGLLSARWHYERIAQLAALLLGSGFLLSTQVKEVWQLYITYSIICGTGVGMMYTSVISTVPLWFRDKSGMATGLLIMAYALSTTILGPLCQYLLSTKGWQMTFFLLGAADLALMGVGGFFVRLPRAKELDKLPGPPEGKKQSGANVSTKDMVRRPQFYFLFVYFVALGSCGLVVINHMSPLLAGELGMTAAAAAMVVSGGALVNGVGRLVCGIIYDKKGSIFTAKFLTGVNIAAITAMFFAYRTGIPGFFIVCACAMLFVFGGHSSTIPSITRGLFGDAHFAGNYSIISMQALFSGIPASIVGMLQAVRGNYGTMFYLMFGCALAAAVCALAVGAGEKKPLA